MNIKEYNEAITAEVIKALEKGVIPWSKPWTCAENATPDPRIMPVSYSTGRPYSLMNQWLIMLSGHGAGEYATFRQISENGGTVRKGEHGATVYFFKTLKPVQVRDANGNPAVDEKGNAILFTPWIARAYHVFNIYTQCDGIAPKWKERAENAERENAEKGENAIIETAQNAVDAYSTREGVAIRHGGDRAYYSPFEDAVTLPALATFNTSTAYYQTAFHELAHSTGTAKRLNRKMGGIFGGYDYGREELVAEIASATITRAVGLEPDIPNTAAYIKSWLKTIKEDTGAITYAARNAQKAAAYVIDGADATENETPAAA